MAQPFMPRMFGPPVPAPMLDDKTRHMIEQLGEHRSAVEEDREEVDRLDRQRWRLEARICQLKAALTEHGIPIPPDSELE